MSATEDPPPLTPEEARLVIQKLGDLTKRIVLIGGQALAFWAERYAERFTLPRVVNSKDIDFCGLADNVALAATRLGGTMRVPEPFSNTPNTGLVVFHDGKGHRRVMDFLGDPFGLDYSAVLEWSVPVDVPVQNTIVTFKVMHPVHCLESRISNVGGLPGYQTSLALEQARVAIRCAHEYLRDRLDAGDPRAARAVMKLNEHIYRFAWGNIHAQKVTRDYGIDPFEAVLVDSRLPVLFRERRHPTMLRNLTRKRSRRSE